MESTASYGLMGKTAYRGHGAMSFSVPHLQLETAHIPE